MVEAGDRYPLRSKRKAISALLPYAVWQERDGHPEMLGAILHAARASKMSDFMWDPVGQYSGRLLSEASPRAVVLVSSHTTWAWSVCGGDGGDWGDLIQWWTAAASAVPYTEEVGRSVQQ